MGMEGNGFESPKAANDNLKLEERKEEKRRVRFEKYINEFLCQEDKPPRDMILAIANMFSSDKIAEAWPENGDVSPKAAIFHTLHEIWILSQAEESRLKKRSMDIQYRRLHGYIEEYKEKNPGEVVDFEQGKNKVLFAEAVNKFLASLPAERSHEAEALEKITNQIIENPLGELRVGSRFDLDAHNKLLTVYEYISKRPDLPIDKKLSEVRSMLESILSTHFPENPE